jgi:cytochrome c553
MVNTYIFVDMHAVEDRTSVYNNPVRNIVGTKHKKAKEHEKIELKRQKLDAKRQDNDVPQEESKTVCSSCHQNGHKSSGSKERPNHKLTKHEEMQVLLGNHTSITRKIKWIQS